MQLVAAHHIECSEIPAPTADDKPFAIRKQLTVYEAAMIYAGRHPYPRFFCVLGGSVRDHEDFLRLGLSEASGKRPRAQRSWDVYCQLKDRINAGVIKPIRPAYDLSGKLDFTRTSIETAELVHLALERRETPKYLRHLQIDGSPIKLEIEVAKQRDAAETQPQKRGRKPVVLERTKEAMRHAINEKLLPVDALADMKEEALRAQFSASRDTVRKARKSVLAELEPVEK
jgi:hypothetical protein